jgi:hypothetical protein
VIDSQAEGGSVEMKTLFEGFDPARYEAEARERWGETDAYRESARRTKGYSADDWKRMADEQDELYGALAAAAGAGVAPDAADVAVLAERHRLLIDRWFYPCSREMQRGLADLYEADPRFAESIDRYRPGLTAYLVAAIRAGTGR